VVDARGRGGATGGGGGMKKAFLLSMSRECPDNSHLSRSFRTFFEKNGYGFVATKEEADIVVVSGCNANMANPQTAEEYADFAKSHPGKQVFYAGCSPRLANEERFAGTNFHLMPYNRMLSKPDEIPGLLGADLPFEFVFADTLPVMDAPWTAIGVDMNDMCYIKVSTGCTEACTFCEIRMAKGYVRTTPIDTILAQFEEGLRRGRKKFWLMSDDIGAWGQDIGSDVSELLRRITEKNSDVELYLHNFHPKFLVQYYEKLEPLFGPVRLLLLPLQSGSDKVLKLMGRRYEIAPVLARVKRLKERWPRTVVASTMLVGFPGETPVDYGQTLKASALLDAVWFIPTHLFENAPAAKLAGKIGPEEMSRRVELAKQLGARLKTHEVPYIKEWDKVVTWTRRPADAPVR
jgi:tRNA A37 methylthiotransferase MiaB